MELKDPKFDRINRMDRMGKEIFKRILAYLCVNFFSPAIHPLHPVNPVSIQFLDFAWLHGYGFMPLQRAKFRRRWDSRKRGMACTLKRRERSSPSAPCLQDVKEPLPPHAQEFSTGARNGQLTRPPGQPGRATRNQGGILTLPHEREFISSFA